MTNRDNWMRFTLASGITIALLVGMGAAASARDLTIRKIIDPNMPPSESVYYGDLNLVSPSGERTLVFRVKGAVGRVCSAHQDAIPNKACRVFAWNGAQPQVQRAVSRARDMAMTGTSTIAPVAIMIATPR